MLYKEVIITSGTKTFKVLSLENGQYKRQREMWLGEHVVEKLNITVLLETDVFNFLSLYKKIKVTEMDSITW